MAEDNPNVVTAHALDLAIRVPSKDAFGGDPYKSAGELAELGAAVIGKHAERLKAAGEAEIRYLWKAAGGSQQGKPTYAECQKAGGLVAFFGGCDFVVWFAADHLYEVAFMQELFEPLMFRQLCAIGRNENSKSLVRVGPDFVGYTSEVEAYGMWDIALKELGRIQAKQPGLFDGLEAPAGWGNVSAFPGPDEQAEATVNSGRGRRANPKDDVPAGELVGV